MVIDKYKSIFNKIHSLDNASFIDHYTVHIINNIDCEINNCKDDKVKLCLKKLLSEIESYSGYFSLEELKEKGFDEELFYNNLKHIITQIRCIK